MLAGTFKLYSIHARIRFNFTERFGPLSQLNKAIETEGKSHNMIIGQTVVWLQLL
jgi:hypothetical protein